MTDHYEIPSKISFVCIPQVIVEPTTKQSLIIKVEEKPYAPLVSSFYSLVKWIYIKVFQNSHLGGTYQKSCSFRSAEALVKN